MFLPDQTDKACGDNFFGRNLPFFAVIHLLELSEDLAVKQMAFNLSYSLSRAHFGFHSFVVGLLVTTGEEELPGPRSVKQLP